MQRLARLSRLRPAGQRPLLREAASSPLFRPTPHRAAAHNYPPAHVHRVRFKRPENHYAKKIANITFILFAIYSTATISLEVLDVYEDSDEDSDDECGVKDGHSGEGGEEGEGVDQAPGKGKPQHQGRLPAGVANANTFEFFLPFPLTEVEVDLPEYTRGTPEWEMFNKIAWDRKYEAMLQKNLQIHVIQAFNHHPDVRRIWGEPVRSQGMFYITFPRRPLPEWSQSGILVRTNGDVTTIGWARKQGINGNLMQTLHNVLWPAPVAHALWQFTREVVSSAANSVFGTPISTASPPPLAGVSMAFPGAARPPVPPYLARREMPNSTATRPLPPPPPANAGQAPQREQRSATKPLEPAAAGDDDNDDRSQFLPSMPPDLLRELAPTAWNRLVQSLRFAWLLNNRPNPPNGSLLVWGRMQIDMTKGYVVVDTHAFWDPKTEKFDPETFRATIIHSSPPPAATGRNLGM